MIFCWLGLAALSLTDIFYCVKMWTKIIIIVCYCKQGCVTSVIDFFQKYSVVFIGLAIGFACIEVYLFYFLTFSVHTLACFCVLTFTTLSFPSILFTCLDKRSLSLTLFHNALIQVRLLGEQVGMLTSKLRVTFLQSWICPQWKGML